MVNQQLVQYIKTEEAQGYTPAQLRQFLISKGYQAPLVDQAISYAAQKNLHPQLGPEHVDDPASATLKTSDVHKPVIVAGTIMLVIGAWILLLAANFLILVGQFAEILGSIEDIPIIQTIVAASIAITVALVIIGGAHIAAFIGLYKQKKWGRIAGIIIGILSCVSLVGLVPGIVYLIILFNKKAKAACT